MAQILTPTGYREISPDLVGEQCCAFDMNTGAPIVNAIESIQWVDATEWARWWTGQEVPPFKFYRINNRWTLNSEQSIWRNGANVCHAKHLQVGDTIYDDADQPITITTIEEVEADGWWRFDISGDHSYIVDGLTLHNASRFWVGGTGNADGSTTTHIASSSGGAGGQSYPGSSDTFTFDGSSGGGTVTWTADHTLQSITCGAFTGTLDWSANNKNVSLSATTGFNCSGSGARTVNLGNGTWTLTGTGSTPWNLITTTNLTFNANSSVIVFTATTANERDFQGGSKTYSTVQVSANSSGGIFLIQGTNTFGTLTITGQNTVAFPTGVTTTITNAFTWTGTSSANILIRGDSLGVAATISVASGSPTMTWACVTDMTFTGGATFTATNSLQGAKVTGITITAPSTSGGGFFGRHSEAGL